ncbi:hypothetical protein BKA62DRAFT_795394 [Auriculariales sp. MPI-PUGE-AT-0066]|nr:hypothetical protein BKA62DRAFT_795394 [Auriculariales sp. MPI-PUGE-AT-0066]
MLASLFALASVSSFAQAYTVVNVDRFMYKNIDPIVFPGQYNKSHMHTFFGSDAVSINTTTSAELQAGCSTAGNPNDLSTYWVPTLVHTTDNGTVPVPLSRFSAYYENIGKAEIPFPQNLKLIAGKAKATSQADLDTLPGLNWFCEKTSGQPTKDLAGFPLATCQTHLQVILRFPDCIDEETFAYAYSGTQNWNETFRAVNRCPENMKRIPQIRFSIRYDLRKALPDGWEGAPPLSLACGSAYCMHGDFFMGWLPEAAQNMLAASDKREFQQVDGPAGKYNEKTDCIPKDADSKHGTSDYLESIEILAATQRSSMSARHALCRHRKF